jgi:hypothetical protein
MKPPVTDISKNPLFKSICDTDIHPPVTDISKNPLFKYIQLMMYVTYNKDHIHH